MTDDEIRKIQNKAIGLAHQWGFGDCGEDFAQEAVIQYLGGRKTGLTNLFIDFLRREFGDTRFGSGRLRQLAERFGVRLDASVSEDEGGSLRHDIIGVTPDEPVLESGLERFQDSLEFRSAHVFQLIAEGYTQREIGAIYGLSAPRISQLFGGLKENAQAMIDYWDIKEKFEDKEVQDMEVQWLTL